MSKWYTKPTKILSMRKDKAFLALENKIVGYPDYNNKGIKVFPFYKK